MEHEYNETMKDEAVQDDTGKAETLSEMTRSQLELSPPWIQYVNAVNAMFEQDPEVEVSYNDEMHSLLICVDNPMKADALERLIPNKKEFGNYRLTISVVPGNTEMTKEQLFRLAFDGNPALHETVVMEDVFTNPITYVIFEKKVVQYYNDDLSDAHGNRTTLYQEVAKDVFGEQNGVFFCTDNGEDGVGKPLGEWP